MLDSDGFVKAGWVHDLRLHQFSSADGVKFVIKGKVKYMDTHACNYMYTCVSFYRSNTLNDCQLHHYYLGP